MGSTEKRNMVSIDELALDKECIRLPTDYLRAALQAADAKRDADALKSALDVVQSDCARRIRDRPAKYGMEKITEAGVAACVIVQKEYKEASAAYAEARHRYDLAQALVWAMEHKKRSLTLLVDLHGMGYFSEARISKAGKQAVEEMTKHAVRRRYAQRKEEE